MGFWNKLGKIALQAAPYVAAPFTGGASLLATGATQALGDKWAASDARKSGLGPSNFDKVLGGVSKGAGAANSLGAFGKLGSMRDTGGVRSTTQGISDRMGRVGGQDLGGWAGMLGGLFGGGGGGQQVGYGGQGQQPNLGNSQGLPPNAMNYAGDPGVDRFRGQMRRGLGPIMGQNNQNNPNLAESIGAGRMEAIQNQPWRQGYDTISYGPEPANDEEGNVGPEIRTPMSPIYPTGGRRRR